MDIIQGILIILLSFWVVLDQQGLVVVTWFPIMVSLFVGLIMGDMETAMVIGGTFQLMSLGVANIGGSSVPNWGLAALVAGNMLPVVGIALLLQVMPAKKYLSLLLIGFVLTAYLSLPIVGVSIIGLALAYYYFTITTQKVATTSANTVEDMGDDFDE